MDGVTVLTSFLTREDPAYSLCNVVADQLRMLLGAGIHPRLIVGHNFQPVGLPWTDKRIDLQRIPDFTRHNKPRWEAKMSGQADQLEAALEERLKGSHVIVTHDLVFQSSELVLHLAALRYAAKHPDIRWLHWIHSASKPASRKTDIAQFAPCRSQFPNSFLVYPNEYSRRRVSVNYGYEENLIKVVPHATDPYTFLGVQEVTRALCEQIGLLDADVVIVYPLRMDPGKQPGKVVKIAAGFKRIGLTPLVIFMDFHSTGDEKIALRRRCEQLAKSLHIRDRIVFTSTWEYLDQYPFRIRAPRAVVRDLMLLSDALILPSRSETYSLIAQELALCGGILVLNGTFPPMRSIYGDGPIYREFGGDIDPYTGLDGSTKTDYQPDEMTYMRDVAIRIRFELEHNPTVRLRNHTRRKRNPRAVFREYLEPLLQYGADSARPRPAKTRQARQRPAKTRQARQPPALPPPQSGAPIFFPADGRVMTAGGEQEQPEDERPEILHTRVPEEHLTEEAMDNTAMFSIVIPTRNRPQALRRALLSLQTQTFGDFEAIVVDDASDAAEKHAQMVVRGISDPRFRCVALSEHSERVIARRTGMEAAGGEWICWLDSDDEYASHYLEVIAQAAKENPTAEIFNFGAVVHYRSLQEGVVGYTRTTIRPTFKPSWNKGEISHQEFKSGKIGSGSFVFKRVLLAEMELLPAARSFDELSRLATDVHHLYEAGKPLGNPWGDDWLAFFRLTRRHRSWPLDPALYVQHVRVAGHDR